MIDATRPPTTHPPLETVESACKCGVLRSSAQRILHKSRRRALDWHERISRYHLPTLASNFHRSLPSNAGLLACYAARDYGCYANLRGSRSLKGLVSVVSGVQSLAYLGFGTGPQNTSTVFPLVNPPPNRTPHFLTDSPGASFQPDTSGYMSSMVSRIVTVDGSKCCHHSSLAFGWFRTTRNKWRFAQNRQTPKNLFRSVLRPRCNPLCI